MGCGFGQGEAGRYVERWIIGDLVEDIFKHGFKGLIGAAFMQGVQH